MPRAAPSSLPAAGPSDGPGRVCGPTRRCGCPGLLADQAARLIVAVVLLMSVADHAGAQPSAPPWRIHLIPWVTHAGQLRPWRDDPRLAGRAAPGYPDDFQVTFLNPDSAQGGRHEAMWVRTIAYDPPNDLFLGVLLNQPDFIRSAREADNVVFRIDRPRGELVAVGAPDYGAPGWPASMAGAFGATLRDGIRAYRDGNDGHNMPEMKRCDAVLTPALRNIPAPVARDERFVAHYVLGRCLAEAYATSRAIEQFRAAIALSPNDADAHMSLLAELSVMTHQRPGTLPAAEEARWERAFTAELAAVRQRFASYDGVQQTLSMVFDPAQEADVDSTWRPYLARLRRVGYAVFRWKQR